MSASATVKLEGNFRERYSGLRARRIPQGRASPRKKPGIPR